MNRIPARLVTRRLSTEAKPATANDSASVESSSDQWNFPPQLKALFGLAAVTELAALTTYFYNRAIEDPPQVIPDDPFAFAPSSQSK